MLICHQAGLKPATSFAAALFACCMLCTASFAAEPEATPQATESAFPRTPPTEPAAAEKTFQTLFGFQMQLLAAEPDVTDPVAIEYDENGLAYVVEMSDYPYTDKTADKPFTEKTADLPIGRVRILEDLDGDGRFDRSTIFAEDLSWPTGVACWKGGVFVTATPDVWYFKDTDGDRKADVRRKLFTGFRKFNVQAVMNNLKWGLDHRIYGAGSSNGGQLRPADQPDAKPLVLSRNDFRFDPRDEALEIISGGARFGNGFDDWGNRFICDIRNPVEHIVLPSHYLARNRYLRVASALHNAAEASDALPVYRLSPPEAWRVVRAERWTGDTSRKTPRSELAQAYVTSTSGITIYRGTAYPKQFYGNAFIGEVAGNLVHRQVLSADGVTFKSVRGDAETEFVRSTDNWFRPTNFVNAPDGTLHVCDMYRETIEHPWSIPDDIKEHLDLESGRDRGRIYRLAPPGFKPPKFTPLGGASTLQLVKELENPNAWQRDTAHRLLFERQDPAAVAPLRKLLHESGAPLARLHALWSLDGLGALGEKDLLAALADQAPGVREHAVRLAEPRLRQSPELLERVLALADDPNVRVRFQTAFTLGETGDERVAAALARIARCDTADPWIRAAVLSSATERAGELLSLLAIDREFPGQDAALVWGRELAFIIGARNQGDEVQAVLASGAVLAAQTNERLQMALVLGLGDGLKLAGAKLPAASRLISHLLEAAQRIAGDDRAEPADRQQALQLLGYAEFSVARPVLVALLDSRQPQAVQIAAIRTLSSFRDKDVAAILLEPYRGYTPDVRNEAVEALLARPERLEPLFDAIESRLAGISQIPQTRRTLLMQHADPKIRERALKLFSADAPSPRKEVLERYRAALSAPADGQRGRKVVERECLTCHRLGDKGYEVGPNLLTIKHRTAEEILTHVLDPNREVPPNFLEYVCALDDGRILTGVIAEETATSITLRRPQGVQETILRQNIEELSNTGHSLMPEGLEQKVNLQEMADVLAFLLGK
ncbi:MAG TPA: PVC-type heme-binding CxxCH protein [Pirellulales bacterium]|nr:PVC-type heme-binding CxxCH protein [Pirellulales bacterium]